MRTVNNVIVAEEKFAKVVKVARSLSQHFLHAKSSSRNISSRDIFSQYIFFWQHFFSQYFLLATYFPAKISAFKVGDLAHDNRH